MAGVPVRNSYISTPFGVRNSSLWSWLGYHTGDDYPVEDGTPVYSTEPGVVDRAEWTGSYGNYIRIKHSTNWTSYYCHLSRRHVSVGDRVGSGTLIGYSGRTGNVTGAHLHYEVRNYNVPVKPSTLPDFPLIRIVLADLRYGRTNTSIVRLQRVLGISADGTYGDETRRAVRAKQLSWGWYGTDADGNIGPVTASRLFRIDKYVIV